MIRLYTGGTTRGLQPCIMLEEIGENYELISCDISGRDKPSKLTAINPLGRLPVLQDGERILDQSAAILIFLGEKHSRFLPTQEPKRSETIRILLLSATDIMPTHGLIFRLLRLPGDPPEAILSQMRARLLNDIKYCESLLSERQWLAGELSIADFALYPIVGQYGHEFLAKYQLKSLCRWIERMRERKAVQAAEKKCPYEYNVRNTLV